MSITIIVLWQGCETVRRQLDEAIGQPVDRARRSKSQQDMTLDAEVVFCSNQYECVH